VKGAGIKKEITGIVLTSVKIKENYKEHWAVLNFPMCRRNLETTKLFPYHRIRISTCHSDPCRHWCRFVCGEWGTRRRTEQLRDPTIIALSSVSCVSDRDFSDCGSYFKQQNACRMYYLMLRFRGVDIVTRLQTGWAAVRILAGARGYLSFSKRPDRLWGPPRLIVNG
jgi:hypothetical protein